MSMSDPRYRKKVLKIDQIGVFLESKYDDFWVPKNMVLPDQKIAVGEEIDLDPKPFSLATNDDEGLPPLLLYEEGCAIFDEKTAIAEMLRAEDVFLNQAKDPETLCVYALCNDMFAWGCADGQNIPYSEVQNLWMHWQHDKFFGVAVWCARQRGYMFQPPVERDIRKAGIWDLDAFDLKPNFANREVSEKAQPDSQEG